MIGHGIDLQQIQHEPGRFRAEYGVPATDFMVAYVGQQGRHKGIDTLVRAFPALLERRPDARLVIAGSQTSYSRELRRLVDGTNAAVRARILLLDDVTAAQKDQILADCDVFASPSEQESFGITTLEAWAHGKAVVLGDGPSQRCVIERGVSGLVVPYGHEALLADTLRTLALDVELRQRLGDAGRDRLRRRYDLSRVVEQYFDLFAAAAGRT